MPRQTDAVKGLTGTVRFHQVEIVSGRMANRPGNEVVESVQELLQGGSEDVGYGFGLEIVRDQLLPWLRDSSGFRGLIRLWNSAEAKTLVITLWADEESLRASAQAGNRFGGLAAETVGTTRLALEDYEVSLFDVADA